MATVSDIISSALRLCGIRDTSDTTRVTEAISSLNLLLKSWGELVIVPTIESLTLTAGDSTYSIGSSGDFDTARPISIIAASITDSSYVDHPVDVTMSAKEYTELTDKTSEIRPTKLYYSAEYSSSLGMIYFNTEPVSAETFVLTSLKGISEYSDSTDTIVQPPEYEKAIVYNLALDLAPEYGVQLNNTIVQQAILLKTEIENRNARITPLTFDSGVVK